MKKIILVAVISILSFAFSVDAKAKSYVFSEPTTFSAITKTDKNYVTYNADGSCYMTSRFLFEGDWVGGNATGVYYVQNKIIYVTWDGPVGERYRLNGKTYKSGGLTYRTKQKIRLVEPRYY